MVGDAFGFAEDPDWSLERDDRNVDVWVDEEKGLVVLKYEDDADPRYLSPARARELATGWERGADQGKGEHGDAAHLAAMLRRAAANVEAPSIRLKVPLPRIDAAEGCPERGLYKVTPGEAKLVVRGVVLELARERLDADEDAPGEASRDALLDPVSDVLAEVEDDVETLFRT